MKLKYTTTEKIERTYEGFTELMYVKKIKKGYQIVVVDGDGGDGIFGNDYDCYATNGSKEAVEQIKSLYKKRGGKFRFLVLDQAP